LWIMLGRELKHFRCSRSTVKPLDSSVQIFHAEVP
jgi:hypothetical protein